MNKSKPLPDQFHGYIATCIDAKGVYPHQCIMLKDGAIGIYAMALETPEQAYATVAAALIKEQPDELIFALDRFCQPGQCTTLGDCLGGAYWDGDTWRTFIIEYQHEPRIVKPIEWENPWWTPRLRSELVGHLLYPKVPS